MGSDWRNKTLGLGNDEPGPVAFYSIVLACVAIAAASHLAFAHFIIYIANPLHVAELVLFAANALIASKIVSLLTYDVGQNPSSLHHPKRHPTRQA